MNLRKNLKKQEIKQYFENLKNFETLKSKNFKSREGYER